MNQDAYKFANIFPQTECLSQDTLLRYVRNELPKSECRRVENHTMDCPLCNAAVEALESDQGAGFEELAASLRSKVQERVEGGKVIEFPARVAAPKRRNWVAGFSIAAAVAILFSFAYIFFGNQPSASGVADNYFSLERPRILRGGDARGSVDPLDAGKSYMVKKEYAEAIKSFELVHSAEAEFLSGDCHYVLSQYEAAAKSYEKVIARQDSEYAHLAEFNLALTHLKLGKVEEARAALQKIADNLDHIDATNAGKALQELDKIDAH
jgi:tetratricopeptide (TPR) repeat protein